LDRHLARLARSADALGLTVGDVRSGVDAVLGPGIDPCGPDGAVNG
ncbi:hypothetical protein HGA03_13460, partial [Cellulomonas denverensis]|nr:hypothetical protein [Cellulomonas denverensis]